MNMESPDFFSEGLMTEPLSEADKDNIAAIAREHGNEVRFNDGKFYFTDKGVYTTFTYDENAKRFVVENSHDAMSENDDEHTGQHSPALESADDINQERAAALHEALAEFRDPPVVE